MRYYPLEKYLNLHDGYCKTFKIDNHHLMLVQTQGQRFLIESFCPHREHPLEAADLNDGVLTCPLHGYQFSVATGDVIRMTEEPCRGLRRYQLLEEDREVGVMLG